MDCGLVNRSVDNADPFLPGKNAATPSGFKVSEWVADDYIVRRYTFVVQFQ